MKNIFLLLTIFLLSAYIVKAQQLQLSVSKASDTKVKIEWKNPYGDSVVQLNVQRSWDSIKNFRTIFVPLSPELPQNGYIDETGGYNTQYYRVFYVLANGSFFFTKSKKNTTGSDFTNEITEEQATDKNFLITVHDDDSVIATLNFDAYKKFRDSIVNYTRDTLYSLTDADILIRYYNNEIRWMPSTHVYTTSDGYVQIFLTDALQKNYRLRFFDETHKPIFNIQHVTQQQLLLDKTDFMHSGWFYFELYEDNKLKERNKFYIPKDF
ncbi:MAG: hypothetical protein JO072_03200 [Parafilimonas sp.]|nr:hypothetical protein [Parafilimonas sp.]